ncbi:MAG TPA: hypothetical protein VFI27_21275 [candidate division Zixibacteria bacterium]|nr:hypothetical protein [candidate division Zixibacteria bacterium]
MNNQPINLLIAIPTMGSIHSLLVSRLLQWTKQFDNSNINFYFTFRMTPHDRARNELVRFFLSQEQLTHIFFVDSDTIPPEDAIQKLLAHDLPFVTGLTPILKMNGDTGKYEQFDNCFLEPTRDDEGSPTLRCVHILTPLPRS